MQSSRGIEPYEARRRSSTSTVVETSRLLSSSSEPTLYRTISRIPEHEPLPADDADVELSKDQDGPDHHRRPVWGTLSVLFLGVFISQTDASLMLATYGKIASEFDDLENAVWLMSALILASCVAQPLYGKLSDIFGRKACLQASYILFAIGTAGVGVGQTLVQVIAARAIQGAGAAVPPIIIAILLVQWKLDLPAPKGSTELSKRDKLKRIDFDGAFFLCSTILAFCLILDLGGQQIPWTSDFIKICARVGVISAVAFVVSARIVPEPIFPLRLFAHYSVVTNCANLVLQSMIQMTLMMTVPIFYQAVQKASTGLAGAYLIPAFAGNTLGGILAGHWIKRTGMFKTPIVLAPILSAFCVILCYMTWNERSSGWASLAIFPGGFAMGMIASASFVGLAAGVDEKDMAIAASGMYLFFNIGSIAAVSSADAVFGMSLKQRLREVLDGRDDGPEIIRRATSSISYVQDADKHIRAILVPAYVYAFHQVNLMGLSLAAVSLLIAVFSKGGRLKK